MPLTGNVDSIFIQTGKTAVKALSMEKYFSIVFNFITFRVGNACSNTLCSSVDAQLLADEQLLSILFEMVAVPEASNSPCPNQASFIDKKGRMK